MSDSPTELDLEQKIWELVITSNAADAALSAHQIEVDTTKITNRIMEHIALAIIEELGHIQVNYGPYVAQTMAAGEWQTIKERMDDITLITKQNGADAL